MEEQELVTSKEVIDYLLWSSDQPQQKKRVFDWALRAHGAFRDEVIGPTWIPSGESVSYSSLPPSTIPAQEVREILDAFQSISAPPMEIFRVKSVDENSIHSPRTLERAPGADDASFRWEWLDLYGELVMQTGAFEDGLAVLPPDLLGTASWSGGDEGLVVHSDLPSSGLLRAADLRGYLRGRLDERRQQGNFSPSAIVMLEQIHEHTRALRAIATVHSMTSYGIRDEVISLRDDQNAQTDLLLDTVIRIATALDEISDQSATTLRTEILAAWEKTHNAEELETLESRARDLIGARAWANSERDTQLDLQMHLILGDEVDRPGADRYSTLALCISFERELAGALRRANVDPPRNLEPLLRVASETAIEPLKEIGERGLKYTLDRYRNHLAHPGRVSIEEMAALREALLSPKKGLSGHCLLSNVIQALRSV